MTRVFWHALVFGLAPILQKLVSLVLLPLYTHYLTAADYGEIELLTIITGLFGVVLRLELRHGYMRAWIAAADDPARAALFRVSLACWWSSARLARPCSSPSAARSATRSSVIGSAGVSRACSRSACSPTWSRWSATRRCKRGCSPRRWSRSASRSSR